jgi:hypothetical protein
MTETPYRRGTPWLTTQSIANWSPPKFPANREKYREIREIKAVAPSVFFGFSLRNRTGHFGRENREVVV